MAAALACGRDAVVSDTSAARLWALLKTPDNAPVHVTLPPADRRRRPGVRIHYRPLTRHEKTRIEGIPVTTVERTLLDIAAIVTTAQLEKAIAEAYARNLTRPARLKRIIDRNPGRRGIERLRYFVESDVMPARTNSPAEARCLALIRRAGLPEPEVNVMVEGKERDFYWRSHDLVLEVDGYQYHTGRPKFEQDRWRDSDLVAAKIRVLHTTWRRITEQPEAVAILLAQALGNA